MILSFIGNRIGHPGNVLVLFDHSANTLDEGSGIELRAYDVIGAVGEDGDAPVAEEGDELVGVRGLGLRAEALGGVNSLFAFDIDEDEVVGAALEHHETVSAREGGVDRVAGETQDLVPEGAKDLAMTDVKDGLWFRRIEVHGVPGKLFRVYRGTKDKGNSDARRRMKI